jgi:hypothetical protein
MIFIRLIPTAFKAFQKALTTHRGGAYAGGPKLKAVREALGLSGTSKKALTSFLGKIKNYEDRINSVIKKTKGKKVPSLKDIEKQLRLNANALLQGKSLKGADREQVKKLFNNAVFNLRNFTGGTSVGTKRVTKRAIRESNELFRHEVLGERYSSLKLTGAKKLKNKIKKKY